MAQELRGHSIGGWAVEDYLGNGSSAVVLSATRDNTRAALKVIDPEMVERYGAEHQRARIMREKSLQGHTHPHLVQILDGGQCTNTNHLYVVMELLEPRTLGEVRTELPVSQIGPLIGQLASAARFLEARNIVHRDIKPDNTNVSSDCTNVKLLDLGVIYPPQDTNDQSAGTGNHFVGTARYSPPEFLYRQEQNSSECWRAITFYQLGATLFDLLMRIPIFDNVREPPALLYEAIKDHVPILAPTDDEVEPWLVDLARRCLTKDWTIRSQLVSWEDFEGPRKPSKTASEIRARIRVRTRRETDSLTNRRQPEAGQPTRRTLLDLFRSMNTTIREVCQEGRVFPPVEIQPIYSDAQCSIVVRTGPAITQSLLGVLEIGIVFQPLDIDGNNVRVSAVSTLCSAQRTNLSSPREISEELFVGPVNSMEFRELLDIFLHAVFECAQGAGEPTTAELSLTPAWR